MESSLAFFGAFNPPTRAHIDLAEHAMRASGREKVIFVPSQTRYIREDQQKDYAFSDAARLAMLARVAEERHWMSFTDIELKQHAQPRTYDTLCMLREAGENPSLLVGADKLIELETKWKYVEEISAEFGIVCMDREDIHCEDLIRTSPFLSRLNITVVEVPDSYRDISSTRVRNCIQEIQRLRRELATILPPELEDFPWES